MPDGGQFSGGFSGTFGGPVFFGSNLTVTGYVQAQYGSFLGPGPTYFGSGSGAGSQVLQGPANTSPTLNFFDTTSGKTRWTVGAVLQGTYDFRFTAVDSAGNQIDMPFVIQNTAGLPILCARPVVMPGFTVAGLPSAATANQRAFVTDALAPVFAAVVAGGGAVRVPVYSDGAAWRVG